MSASFDCVKAAAPSGGWSPLQWTVHAWLWIVLLALFVVLEIWGDPLLASLVLCLKLGWRHVLVAFRLGSHKPPAVGQAIAMYCLAMACSKVAMAGVVLASAVVIAESLFGFPLQLGRFLAGYVLLSCGLIVGETMVLFAAGRSCQSHIRGWLDGTIYENLLKPHLPLSCHSTRNHVPWLLAMGMVLMSLTWLPAPVFAVVGLLLGNPGGIVGGIVFSLFWFLTIRPMRSALANAARTPEEC